MVSKSCKTTKWINANRMVEHLLRWNGYSLGFLIIFPFPSIHMMLNFIVDLMLPSIHYSSEEGYKRMLLGIYEENNHIDLSIQRFNVIKDTKSVNERTSTKRILQAIKKNCSFRVPQLADSDPITGNVLANAIPCTKRSPAIANWSEIRHFRDAA